MINCGIFKSDETVTDEPSSEVSQWSKSSRVVLETVKEDSLWIVYLHNKTTLKTYMKQFACRKFVCRVGSEKVPSCKKTWAVVYKWKKYWYEVAWLLFVKFRDILMKLRRLTFEYMKYDVSWCKRLTWGYKGSPHLDVFWLVHWAPLRTENWLLWHSERTPPVSKWLWPS